MTQKLIETNHSFTSVVLQRFPEDEDGKTLLENINKRILEPRREGTRKKNSKMVGTCLCLRQGSFKVIKDPQKPYKDRPNCNISRERNQRFSPREELLTPSWLMFARANLLG